MQLSDTIKKRAIYLAAMLVCCIVIIFAIRFVYLNYLREGTTYSYGTVIESNYNSFVMKDDSDHYYVFSTDSGSQITDPAGKEISLHELKAGMEVVVERDIRGRYQPYEFAVPSDRIHVTTAGS